MEYRFIPLGDLASSLPSPSRRPRGSLGKCLRTPSVTLSGARSGGNTAISQHAACRPVETDRLTERGRTYAGSRSQMCRSGELRWNEGRLKKLPEEGKEGGLKGTYCKQSFSQAILPGLIQRLRDAGLTKAPRTPGLQDFLRIMSTGRCTWDHLLWENMRNYKPCLMRIKFFSRGPGFGLIPAFLEYLIRARKILIIWFRTRSMLNPGGGVPFFSRRSFSLTGRTKSYM